MKILVAGAGVFGTEHLTRLAAIGGIDLAVAETRSADLERARATFPILDADGDAFALLARFKPDGVVIATPAAAHAPLAVAALERHIPVLVEKPVTPDSASMRGVVAAAEESKAFLQPGHILRFSEGHRQLRGVLRDGEIGTLLQFSSHRYRDDSHVRLYPDIDPVLMTLIHDIDLALWFDGGTAVAASAVRSPPGTTRSLTAARVESSTGGVWQLATAWLHPSADCPPDRVMIVGTAGSAELEVGSHIDVYGKTRRRIPLSATDDPLRTELDIFLAGVRAGHSRADVSPGDALQGLLAAEMILAALASRR